MLILTWIRKIYKVLSADASPAAIAFGAAFGLTLGCVPVSSGAFIALLALLLVFRVQLSTAILFWVIGRAVTFAGGAALFDGIGESLLYAGSLTAFWDWFLDEVPGLAWSGFDCPAVLGGFVFGAAAGAALFVPLRLVVISYRRWVHDKVSKNRFFRWLTNFWVVKLCKWLFAGDTP
jgi:uncharacterized protein (TIGR03546 family)